MNVFPSSYPYSNRLGLVFPPRYIDTFLSKVYKNPQVRNINLELAELLLWAMTTSDTLDKFEKLIYSMIKVLLKRSQIQRKEELKKFVNIELISGVGMTHKEFEQVEINLDVTNSVGKPISEITELDRRRRWEMVQKLKEKFQ